MRDSPRAWLRWAARVLERQASPSSPRYEFAQRGDFRIRDSRETALDVKIMAERASAKCCRNGVGYMLLIRYYVGEAAWASFSPREKKAIKKTARVFRCSLCRVDYVCPCDKPVRSCARGRG